MEQFSIGDPVDSRKCGARILYRPAHCRPTTLAWLTPGSGVAPDRRSFVLVYGNDHGQFDRVLRFVIADLWFAQPSHAVRSHRANASRSVCGMALRRGDRAVAFDYRPCPVLWKLSFLVLSVFPGRITGISVIQFNNKRWETAYRVPALA